MLERSSTTNSESATNGEVPSGEVAFLMTDIEGSTRLWDRDPDAMRRALERHDNIIGETVEEYGGYVFCRAGDSFAAAFESAEAAFRAATDSQRRISSEVWPADIELKVRMAIHVGEADERDGNYFGPNLNRCSRLLGLCAGGRIAVSEAVRDQICPDQASLTDLGVRGLPGLREPEHVWYCDVDAVSQRR